MSLHELLRRLPRRFFEDHARISLEIAAWACEIQFQIWIPVSERTFIESQLRSAYPSLRLSPASDRQWGGRHVGVAELRLAWGNYLPIRTSFESEPLANLLWMLAGLEADDEVVLQVIIRSKSGRWQLQAQSEAQRLHEGLRFSGTAGLRSSWYSSIWTARRFASPPHTAI